MGIQVLDLLLKHLAFGTAFLLLVELLLRHLHALQLKRQALVRAFGSLHHLGLVVQDALQLGLRCLEFQLTAGVLLSTDGLVLIRILEVLHLSVVLRQGSHVLLMGTEDVVGDIKGTLLLGESLSLRLVQFLLLCELAGDGVGGVGNDLLLLTLNVGQLLGSLPCPLHLLLIDILQLIEVTLHLYGDFQTFRHLLGNGCVVPQSLFHRLVKCLQLVECLLSDEIGNQCFVCHISIAL